MKKIIPILILIVSCFSCSTSKQTSSYIEKIQNLEKQLTSYIQSSKEIEKTSYLYKDSLVYIKALLEKSSSIGRDSSYLETNYAYSLAYFQKDGKLFHSIQNKDSIPSTIKKIYITKYTSKTDTVHKQDSVFIYKDKQTIADTKIVKVSFWSQMKAYAIGFIIGIICCFVIFIILKIRKIVTLS